MRKNVFGRQFKRDRNERKALFKGLLSSLVLHGRIKTTEEKAKAIQGQAEKLVTKAKKGPVVANLMQIDLDTKGIKKLINEVAPQFMTRPGGYTRIVRLGKRFSDNASVVLLEWVEEIQSKIVDSPEPKKVVKAEKEIVEAKIEAPKKTKKAPVKKVAKVTKEEKK